MQSSVDVSTFLELEPHRHLTRQKVELDERPECPSKGNGQFGIRVALGARHPDILRPVMGQGTRWIAIGVLGGVPLAMGATRLLSAML
jgi:uncharacterized membrane protein